jgi:glutamate N-acetyltransferase/amino-acid N-acetyltransferase
MDLFLPKGFIWSSGKAGLKPSGKTDLAIALASQGATAAAMFTTNLVAAAPVVLGREHLKRSGGKVSALVVNAGNANCANGAHGMKGAIAVCTAASKLLGRNRDAIFPSSTGIIGVPLPYEKINNALPAVFSSASSSDEALHGFATAIMTTDTRPKVASTSVKIGGKTVNIVGVAKGAGMIHPNMATMLGYVFTDIAASPSQLKSALKVAVDQSFNCISVDGDTSTNDTVLLMASGASAAKLNAATAKQFQKAFNQVCFSLADQIVEDGEGVSHVIELVMKNAPTEAAARLVARTIATSCLVKTAWAGADPNWGRMLAAVGRSGAKVDVNKVDISVGPHKVCAKGSYNKFDPKAAHDYMKQRRFNITINLNQGKAALRFLTCDLTAEYVAINSLYST